MPRLWILLLLLGLWKSCSVLCATRSGKGRHQSRDALASPQDHAWTDGAREREAGLAAESDFLEEFAGKKRLWVITAPSYADNYLRMMEKQIKDMESEGLNCRLAERDTLIVTIIQNAMMEGKIKRSTLQGEVTVETMDPDVVSKLLHYLELEDQTFSMLIVKKNMRIGERFPYPVRVEAILEVIDQLPVRKLEKVTRKWVTEKCKVIKRRLVTKKPGKIKKRVFSPQRMGNVTSVSASQMKPVDKKAALRNKVQSILNGRSRFIIRKTPTKSNGEQTIPAGRSNIMEEKHNDQRETTGHSEDMPPTGESNRHNPAIHEEKKRNNANSSVDKTNGETKAEQSPTKSKSKRKGKGKKKGKRGGRKSQQEVNDKNKGALKELLQQLKGKRRLLVISSPSDVTSEYIQQRDGNELHSCDFALRRVSVLSVLGSDVHLHHYQTDAEARFASLPDPMNPEMVSEIRKEFDVLSKDFSMVITDYELKPNRVFDQPTAASVITAYIDSFPSRRSEKEQEKKAKTTCPQSGPDNSLLRFMSKRRLLIISAPSEDDYYFQQQSQALSRQECSLGIRHFALLKLVGVGPTATGSVELLPLNGRSQSEKEPLTQDVVKGLRDQLKINRDFFSMLVVEKDGDVKAWFPSPMWSLSNIYDLVDSMEMRQQEEKLQKTLGIYCPDESGGSYHGYQEEPEESYLYHRTEE